MRVALEILAALLIIALAVVGGYIFTELYGLRRRR